MFAEPLTDAEFIATVNQDKNIINSYGVMLTAADCVRRGYSVSKPLFGLGIEYSLIVDRGGTLDRIQVRVAGKRGYQVAYGNPDNYDFLAIVDRYSSRVYYVPTWFIDRDKPAFFLAKENRDMPY